MLTADLYGSSSGKIAPTAHTHGFSRVNVLGRLRVEIVVDQFVA